ncbi:cytochrome c family protein [Constantimarinum furrinae]|uniref:Cytochrome c family protein n=1 Tax=Constantimarinum furrinae TaxID=2562285 RepID=A0A7G8PQK4_9FLAO|nr:cytochrome c family protein [Constantimarinum furrinae]QNJ96620.1 Cytochrome c family protein [Constantimarinum furrinae]
MKEFRKHIVLFFCLTLGTLNAQISPGDLTDSHSKFEGMSNCTLCHELGSKVTNNKCLECHTEIKSLLSQNKGFHATPRVESQDCFKCHSEHHGRNFDMIRFDTQNFNHDLTGFELEGAHASVDCRLCHAPKNIKDPKLRKRSGTYLGLDDQCLSCHDDYHQGTLPVNCLQCHNMNAFSPVLNFDHDQADFKLKGKHLAVDCKECHKVTTKNGSSFQQFTGMNFSDCKACHQDPHNNQLPGACAQCHTESSFNTFTGRGNFNHSRTDFDLKGQHKRIDCFTCHANTSNISNLFQDRANVPENNCVACHSDPHDNKYGQDCAKCHSEESFLALKDMDFFDHSITDFPLEGMHTGVDCRACHIERFSTPIDFSECKSCHSDYHNGEFAENGISPDCKTCHTLDKGFDFTLFTIEDHQKSDFPLEGAHIATPCFACHVDERENRWTFAMTDTRCIDCHSNFHEGFLAAEFIPNNDCTACHGNDSWDAITFDHSQTDWPLTGQHNNVSCSACHFEISEDKKLISQNFSNLDTNCASCHENIHGDSFAVNGITDCARCHVTNSWFPEKFDHNNTRFALTGKHAQVDCRACHELKNESGTTTVVYKLGKLDCKDCHL